MRGRHHRRASQGRCANRHGERPHPAPGSLRAARAGPRARHRTPRRHQPRPTYAASGDRHLGSERVMNPNRPARLNRTVLAVLGLVCLAAGGVVLLIGTGLLGGLLPVPADAPLLPPGLVIPVWGPSAVAAVAVVIGLLALRWLI